MPGGGGADDPRERCPGPAEADRLPCPIGRKAVPPVRGHELEADSQTRLLSPAGTAFIKSAVYSIYPFIVENSPHHDTLKLQLEMR